MTDKETNLLREFNVLKPALAAWGSYVDEILENIILKKDHVSHFVKMYSRHRIKEDKSFLYKVFYRKRSYSNPLLDIEDKIGTRIVLLKSDEIKHVADLIQQHDGWIAKISKDLKGELEDQPKIFDYQSMHIIVKPKEDYAFEGNKDFLTCEVQIRTLLQHAFAEVSHDSTYKGPYKNDAEIIRHLAKSMALMEATDDYFSRIFSLMSSEKREFSVYIKELTRLFKEFDPSFDVANLNFDLTDRIFELLTKKKIELGDLEAFVEKYKKDLSRAIKPKNGIIFQQPISLLIGYYIINHQEFFKNSWPLNNESLLQVYRAFNISSGNY